MVQDLLCDDKVPGVYGSENPASLWLNMNRCHLDERKKIKIGNKKKVENVKEKGRKTKAKGKLKLKGKVKRLREV